MNSSYATVSILSLFVASLFMEGGFLVYILGAMLAIQLVEWATSN